MREDDFTPSMQRHLVRTVQNSWAFVPPELPPSIDFGILTVRLISEAERAVGELRGLTRNLPNPGLLVRPFMRREAVLSSRIEGTLSDVEQMLLFEDAPARVQYADAEEVSNYLAALDLGLQHISGGNLISLWLIRQLHQRLMHGVRGQDKNPGEFRVVQNATGSRGQGIDQAMYVPPPPTEVDGLLRNLEWFVNQSTDLPVLVKTAIAHYQFEAIHPFHDGNGRVGRLLITLMLARENALPLPLLYASAYFEDHRDAYYAALLAVSQRGEWLGWIDLFNVAVATQARDAVNRSEHLLELRRGYITELQSRNVTGHVLTLLDLIFERPSITVPRAASQLDVTQRAASLMIRKLETAGIIEEVTGQARNRVWMAREILEILNKD